MNKIKRNSNKIVKKERIRKFHEFERRAVAVATAASFAFMLSSCEEIESPATTDGYTGETSFTEVTTVKTSDTSRETVESSSSAEVQEPQTPDIDFPDIFDDDAIEAPDQPTEGDKGESEETEIPDIPDKPETPEGPKPEDTLPKEDEEDEKAEPVIEERISYHYETISRKIVYVYDANMYDDESVVTNEGRDGTVRITVYSTFIDGVLDSSYSQRETISFSQNRVITVGTKPSVTTEEKTVKETVEKYSTIYEECDTMEVGTTQIKTAGKDSVATRTYRYTYTRGTLTSTELISEIISERVDEVVLVGTKEPEKVTDTSFGMPFIDAAHGGVNYSVTQYFSSSHTALDFGVYYGDPIVAAMSGTVIAAYDEGYFSTDNILWTYGTYVVIQHDGYKTYYAHLSSRTVSVGDKVQKGQVIGYSGNTGRVNASAGGPYAGTHLHCEIRKYYPSLGVYHTVDPTLYLPWWN